MPNKVYASEPGGPLRVEIEWRGIWKDIRVRIDGHEVGTFANGKELQAGKSFPFPEGGPDLDVRLVTAVGATELRLTRAGVALPGTNSDPATRVKTAAGIFYFIAGLNVVLGLVAALGSIDFLLKMGIGWANVVEGAIYALIAWRTSKRSRIAAGIGIALFALDTAFTIVSSASAGGSPGVGGLVARVFLFVPLVQGFRAMNALLAKEAEARVPPNGPFR